jgi:hypothetical protein
LRRFFGVNRVFLPPSEGFDRSTGTFERPGRAKIRTDTEMIARKVAAITGKIEKFTGKMEKFTGKVEKFTGNIPNFIFV